ncbi:hypothetical protein [Clostridium sp. UBA6640]|uniref:hypothetical protein n=1 Tax=Clostridium sp. UBA6640 TaxID=1946370 RepID=UPI0025BB1260|nr:hypothetical protein [Clostridium sp. UBA6640]
MREMLILFSLSVTVISGAVYTAYEKIKYTYEKRNNEIEILKRKLDINNSLIEKKLNEINEMLNIDNITFNPTLKEESEVTRNIVNTSINGAISSVHEAR